MGSTPASHEAAVGILSYANEAPGFSGILKQRYTDFKVNEVDLQGRVVRLTSTRWEEDEPEGEAPGAEPASSAAAAPGQETDGPSADGSAPPAAQTEDGARKDAASEPAPTEQTQAAAAVSEAEQQQRDEAALADFARLTCESDAERLRPFLAAVRRCEAGDARDEGEPEALLLAPEADKARRTAVHAFFKAPAFTSLLTEAVTPKQAQGRQEAAVPAIRVTYLPPDWPGGDKPFLRFVLYKENMETQAALALLGRYLHAHWSAFAIAGSKDKRGTTSQLVTMHKVHPRRLANLNARLRGVQTGDYGFAAEQLHLGSLSGNAFTVILRSVSGGTATVAAAADALARSGFINYFGLQRFGNAEAPTHHIGRQLLKGDWEAAVRLIMQPKAGEREPLPEARRLFEAGDLAAAAQLVPPYAAAEKAVLKGLLAQGRSNPVGALLQIPRNLRTMYLHAVQSYLWNAAASARVAAGGVQAVQLGDLVLPPGCEANAGGEGEEADEPASAARLAGVHTVTEADLAAGTFSIEDVVLPLPGAQVVYPANETAEVYRREAARLGVSLDACAHRVREFAITSLPGDYRRLLHRPRGLRWQLLAYSDPNQDLGHTDLAQLRGQPPPPVQPLTPGAPPPLLARSLRGHHGEEAPAGSLVALQLQFQLPPSCYATMLIRELLKETTATVEHRARTQADAAAAAAEAEQQRQPEAGSEQQQPGEAAV